MRLKKGGEALQVFAQPVPRFGVTYSSDLMNVASGTLYTGYASIDESCRFPRPMWRTVSTTGSTRRPPGRS
jgi:hypothetical protein